MVTNKICKYYVNNFGDSLGVILIFSFVKQRCNLGHDWHKTDLLHNVKVLDWSSGECQGWPLTSFMTIGVYTSLVNVNTCIYVGDNIMYFEELVHYKND